MYSDKPKYLWYINIAVEVASGIPPYSSKHSRKDFTQQQLMALIVLKQKSKLRYDCFVDDFKIRNSAILGLGFTTKIPSASCLKMFTEGLVVVL